MNIPLSLAFLAGSPGPGEVIVLFLVILLLFGPKRLPQVARMIGKALSELRRASQDFRDQIMRIDETPAIDEMPVEPSPDERNEPAPLSDGRSDESEGEVSLEQMRDNGEEDAQKKNDLAG